MLNRTGQALVEYVLILALVAVTLAGALILFRQAAAAVLESVNESVECPSPGQGGVNPGNDGGTAPGQCRKAS